MPLSQVEDLVDTRLAPQISQLSGVGLVSISGGQKPAVRIQVNPVQLSSYGLNLEDVRTALTRQVSIRPKETSTARGRTIRSMRTTRSLKQRLQDVVIAYSNGAPVFVKDVARVVDGVENTDRPHG